MEEKESPAPTASKAQRLNISMFYYDFYSVVFVHVFTRHCELWSSVMRNSLL